MNYICAWEGIFRNTLTENDRSSKTDVFIRENRGTRKRRPCRHSKTHREQTVMWWHRQRWSDASISQGSAENWQQTPEPGRYKEGAFSTGFREPSSANTLISDFYLPEPWENQFYMVLSHPAFGTLLQQPWELIPPSSPSSSSPLSSSTW